MLIYPSNFMLNIDHINVPNSYGHQVAFPCFEGDTLILDVNIILCFSKSFNALPVAKNGIPRTMDDGNLVECIFHEESTYGVVGNGLCQGIKTGIKLLQQDMLWEPVVGRPNYQLTDRPFNRTVGTQFSRFLEFAAGKEWSLLQTDGPSFAMSIEQFSGLSSFLYPISWDTET
ncbi:hypothetical protein HAX54_044053 [Datura stramonium]|uniref:Uncharacterized protein n=1 Tax=Datura stramonium TaxID=4076 RepID=A0ABS8W212_DATST|nr:hypothetical protein [Datura stramonium]